MLNASSLNDAQLDQAYAASYDARDSASSSVYASEIVSRMTTPGSWLVSLGGSFVNALGGNYSTFPLYEARINANGGYTFTSAAGTSVVAAVEAPFVAVGDIVSGAANSIADTANAASNKILWVIGGLALVLLLVKNK